jgi:hypothetical protein
MFLCIEFLVNMSASADILAMAKVEVDLASIPEGKNVSYTTRLVISKEGVLTGAGHHQMARQARLRPPPNRRRDRTGQQG